jgi:hypothetical protein
MSVADFQAVAEDRSLKIPGDEKLRGDGSKTPQGAQASMIPKGGFSKLH